MDQEASRAAFPSGAAAMVAEAETAPAATRPLEAEMAAEAAVTRAVVAAATLPTAEATLVANQEEV